MEIYKIAKQAIEKRERSISEKQFFNIEKLHKETEILFERVYSNELNTVMQDYVDENFKFMLKHINELKNRYSTVDILSDTGQIRSKTKEGKMKLTKIKSIEDILRDYFTIPEEVLNVLKIYLLKDTYYVPLQIYCHYKENESLL